MKNYLIIAISILCFSGCKPSVQLTGIREDLEKMAQDQIFMAEGFTEEEAGKAIKEALTKGIEKGVAQLSKPDGYFKDLSIKVLMPPEAQEIESKLRSIGQGKLVDDAVESMNRGAEDAAILAKNIFVDAIINMSIQDAIGIVNGADDAATEYLKSNTRQQLTDSFKPVVKNSLDKVDATKYWNSVISTYNRIPFVSKVNPNLDEHVTEKAIEGLFLQMKKEEKAIRENPMARTTELLKKVFK